MSDDLFGGDTPVQTTTFDDLLGKYKDNDGVVKAVVEKDNFIEQLKRENAEMRETIQRKSNEEEFLKRLEEVTRKPAAPQEPPVQSPAEQPVAGMKPEDVLKLVEERDAAKTKAANLATVTEQLKATFGDDFRSRVQTQAKELGVGTQFLTSLASENPQAFYRLMGMDKTEQASPDIAPPRPSVNTFAPPTAGKKDFSYYQELRRKNGESWYFSLPVQQEIWKAAKEAENRGEKFLP